METIQFNSATRLVVLRDADRAFCGGGDVAGMYAQRDNLPGLIGPLVETFHAAILAMKRLPIMCCANPTHCGWLQ